MNSSIYSQYLSQPFPQQNSQTPTQSQDEVGNNKGKNAATWDDSKTMVFINLCVVEVRAGNRPDSHFSTLEWKNLVEKFNTTTNLSYTRIQLKNHWDHLKRRWKDWRRLLRNETGLGWDCEKETIDATDEWWDRKIKEAPEVARFRDKGPLLIAEQEFLFDDVIATGSRIWLPISGVLPPHMQNDDVDPVEDDVETINLAGTMPINTDAVEDEGSSLRRKHPFPAIICKKAKKANTGETLAKSFATVVELINNKRETCRPLAQQHTIKECLEVLDKINNIEEGDEMWLFATNLFLDPSNRELFLSMISNTNWWNKL